MTAISSSIDRIRVEELQIEHVGSPVDPHSFAVVAQLAHMAGGAGDPDKVHAERERVGRHCQADRQPVVACRVGQQAVALKVLDEWLGGARVGDVDRGQQDPRQDLRALRDVVEGFPLPGRQPVAVVRDNRRIRTAESNLHRVVERTADHRDGVQDGCKKVEASDGHEHVGQKANEPH
jgi:hypothetical protein